MIQPKKRERVSLNQGTVPHATKRAPKSGKNADRFRFSPLGSKKRETARNG